MRRSLLSLALLAVLTLLALPSAGHAQEHAVAPETLDAMAVAHGAAVEIQRSELRSFLQRPDVRRIAEGAGIDVVTAETAVAALSEEDVRGLSTRLIDAEMALAGGDSVVVSTTAIIIALLVVIIILVA